MENESYPCDPWLSPESHLACELRRPGEAELPGPVRAEAGASAWA